MRSRILHLVVAYTAFFAVAAAHAVEPRIDEILLTMRVRQILHEDDELRGQNFGVTIEKGVAVLWGPVTSLDLGLRAESNLRGIPEIRDVRNELVIVDSPLRLGSLPSRTRPAPGMPLESAPRLPPASPPVPSAAVIRR
jgi:BON domain